MLPLIVTISVIGVFGVTGNIFHIYMLIAFGVLGFLMKRHDYPGAPMILGLVLGPMMEQSLRQSLIMSNGDYSILFNRPISLTLMILVVLWVGIPALMRLRGKRTIVLDDE